MSILSTSYIDFSLRQRRRLVLFLSLVALVALVGSTEAVKIAAVTAIGKSTQASMVEKGIALDPDNPVLHNRLGQLYSSSLEPPNLAEGVSQARQATVLNPNKSDYWLTLASTCESARLDTCADQALQRSTFLAPMVPSVWWAVGNQYLRAGRSEVAFACFRRLLTLSPDYASPVFDLTLHTFNNPKMILEGILSGGKDPMLDLAFADYMSANNHFDAAAQAWTQIVSVGGRFTFGDVQPYLERLLVHGRYQEAREIWEYLERHGIIDGPADNEKDNMVFNGSFEHLPLAVEFDWSLQPSPYVSVDFADVSTMDGARCLHVDFPVGQNEESDPVYQIVPVVANQVYTLTAHVRSTDIASDSGPRLRVTDPACLSCLNAWTDATLGTSPWHMITLRVSVGPQTQAVRLSVWRPRSRTFPMDISGSFWLDDVSLRPERQ